MFMSILPSICPPLYCSFSAKVNSYGATCCLFPSIAESFICVHSVKNESKVNSECCVAILPKAKKDKQLPSLWSVCLCTCCWIRWMRRSHGRQASSAGFRLTSISRCSQSVPSKPQAPPGSFLHPVYCLYLLRRSDSVGPNKISYKSLFRESSSSGDTGSSRLNVQMIKVQSVKPFACFPGLLKKVFTVVLSLTCWLKWSQLTIVVLCLLPGGTYCILANQAWCFKKANMWLYFWLLCLVQRTMFTSQETEICSSFISLKNCVMHVILVC